LTEYPEKWFNISQERADVLFNRVDKWIITKYNQPPEETSLKEILKRISEKSL